MADKLITDNITGKTVSSEIDSITYARQIELDRFGIKNDGTSPKETSVGLNQALQYANGKGFDRIILPTGTYLIDETNPIIIDLKDMVIDLNGSTLQINTNGLARYSIVQFIDGAENIRFVNGIVRGDRDTHDYLTIKSSHEWCNGIEFKGGKNLQMDNVTVTNLTGYGIFSDSGTNANRFYALFSKDTVQGSIAEDGSMAAGTDTTRTTKPYDISVCGGQFELGYTLGFQGYPYLLNKNFTSFFYNKDMNFIEKKECVQYRKVDIPSGAKYVHFVFPQASIVSSAAYYAWISNFKPPTNVQITNCLINDNRCLGLSFCGGQQWAIENNIFEGNGSNAPGYAVDFEDGWELMQDVVFKNNKFINNKNDLVVSAGDNLVFEGNEFQKLVYIWERTTNYAFTGNTFKGGSVYYKIKREGCKITNNQYINSSVNTVSFSSLTFTLANENMTESHVFANPGTKLIDCTIKAAGRPYIHNAILEHCNINVAQAYASKLRLNNCNITNSKIELLAEHYFDNCVITDSTFLTSSNTTKIQFKGCEFLNSQMTYTTYGAAVETIFEECNATMTTVLPLVRLSAGKTKNLIFKNNTVVNQTAKPVIELYDTNYTVPNGNAAIEGNSFTQSKYGYVFDGVNITKGIFNLTARNNTISGAQMLSPKYIGNMFFNIIN